MNDENNLQIIKTCFNVLLRYPKNSHHHQPVRAGMPPRTKLFPSVEMAAVGNVFAFSPLLLPGGATSLTIT